MKCDYIHESDEYSLRQEADLHQKLSHPNIIKCLGVFLEPGHNGIIFELAEYGELRNYLKVNSEIKTRLKMLHEVSSGMKYLHSLNPPVIHGDLKIQNILVGKNYKAKICDFGFSRWKNYSQSRSAKDVPRGTSTHIPPEYLKDSQLRKTEKFDVYSFGICAWEIITLERPFANATGNEGLIQNWVSKGQRPPVTQYPFTVVPQIVIDVLKSCWDNDVRIRPKFADIENKVKPSKLNRYFRLSCKPKDGTDRKWTYMCEISCNWIYVPALHTCTFSASIAHLYTRTCSAIKMCAIIGVWQYQYSISLLTLWSPLLIYAWRMTRMFAYCE